MIKDIKVFYAKRLKNSKYGGSRLGGQVLVKSNEIGHTYTYLDLFPFKTQSDSKVGYQISPKDIEGKGEWITARCHWTKKGTLIIEEVLGGDSDAR